MIVVSSIDEGCEFAQALRAVNLRKRSLATGDRRVFRATVELVRARYAIVSKNSSLR